MPSRSLRRRLAILVFAALAPVAGIHPASAANAVRRVPASAKAPAPRHNAVLQFLLDLATAAGFQIDTGPGIDGNG